MKWSCLVHRFTHRRPSCPTLTLTLTPSTRLRLARLVVEGGWTYAAAAKMFMVSPRTAKKWADRYRAEGPAGMADRSSRPHHCPTKTPTRVVRRIVRAAVAPAAGSGPDRGRLGLPASTVHAVLVRCRINRLVPHRPGHRRAAAPLRARPPRLADPRRRHQVRQHPRRRRASRYVGRQQGERNGAPRPRTGTAASRLPAR